MENNKPANNEIQIELSEEMAQGTYANLAIISHSSSEFIKKFGEQLQAGNNNNKTANFEDFAGPTGEA